MGKSRKAKPNLSRVAQDQFGFDQLRPGQKEAIQSILNGHDTLAVMPTGFGKSAIYQMAAYLIPGCTVVVSPLVALQRDQVKSLTEQDVGEAALLNSTLVAAERQKTLEQLEEGDLEFLFLAPEQFNNRETLERLQAAEPSLFVVDEAHCISAWGHDFRPDYLRLAEVIAALGHPPILALTATAAPLIQQEIVERLGMKNPAVLVQGFDRPNLWLSAERFEEEAEKQVRLIERVQQVEKPGIIYVATRKRTEELAAELREQGVNAQAYHAGMKAAERESTEAAFMQDEIEVLVATTAFGMGVNKPNIRFVFHADISDSIDSYYQEIGRAGRDEQPAQAILFYNPSDLNLKRFFAGTGQVTTEQVEQVVSTLRPQSQPITAKALQEQTELSQAKLRSVLNYLSQLEAITTTATGEIALAAPSSNSQAEELSLAEAVLAIQEQRRQFERSRLEMMRGYAEVRNCRRAYLLSYFGEAFAGGCDRCDNCKQGIELEVAGHQPYAVESRVVHKSWGEGTVMRYEGNKMLILFEQVGYKTLDVQTAILRQLLQVVE